MEAPLGTSHARENHPIRPPAGTVLQSERHRLRGHRHRVTFRTWGAAFCRRAGLAPRYARNVESARNCLREPIDCASGSAIGRQPRAKEMKQPLSPISISKYQKAFGGSWHAVCLTLVASKSGLTSASFSGRCRAPLRTRSLPEGRRRAITLSLRYEVRERDNFRCVKCGPTPATAPSVQLHVDHVIPWSGEGPSDPMNLQTLCAQVRCTACG